LNRWTNRRYKDAVHRVSDPHLGLDETCDINDEKRMLPERYSIAVFSFPDVATVVEPLESCFDDDNPRKYKAISAGEYLAKKRADVFSTRDIDSVVTLPAKITR
jgi:isopenicillin N synthase-like dioxygenase